MSSFKEVAQKVQKHRNQQVDLRVLGDQMRLVWETFDKLTVVRTHLKNFKNLNNPPMLANYYQIYRQLLMSLSNALGICEIELKRAMPVLKDLSNLKRFIVDKLDVIDQRIGPDPTITRDNINNLSEQLFQLST